MSKTKLSFGFNNPKFSDQILQIQYSPTADSLTTSSSDSPLLPKEYHISRVLLAGESAFFLQMFSSSEFLESKLPVRLQIREDEHAAWDILLRCIYHEKTPLLPKGESDKEIANGLDLYLKRPMMMKPTQTSRKRKLEEEEEEVKTFDFSIFTDARIQTAVSPSTPAHHDMWNRMTLLVQVLSLCDQFRFHGIASEFLWGLKFANRETYNSHIWTVLFDIMLFQHKTHLVPYVCEIQGGNIRMPTQSMSWLFLSTFPRLDHQYTEDFRLFLICKWVKESSRLDRLPHNLDVENDASAVTVLSLWHMAVPLLQNIQWGYLTISGLIYYAMTIGGFLQLPFEKKDPFWYPQFSLKEHDVKVKQITKALLDSVQKRCMGTFTVSQLIPNRHYLPFTPKINNPVGFQRTKISLQFRTQPDLLPLEEKKTVTAEQFSEVLGLTLVLTVRIGDDDCFWARITAKDSSIFSYDMKIDVEVICDFEIASDKGTTHPHWSEPRHTASTDDEDDADYRLVPIPSQVRDTDPDEESEWDEDVVTAMNIEDTDPIEIIAFVRPCIYWLSKSS